jgi:hypothetical protein
LEFDQTAGALTLFQAALPAEFFQQRRRAAGLPPEEEGVYITAVVVILMILRRLVQGKGTLRQRGFFQPLRHLPGVLTELFLQHLICPQVPLHSRHVRDPPQVASKYQPVKPAKHPADLITELRYKLFHGVLLSFGLSCLGTTNILR